MIPRVGKRYLLKKGVLLQKPDGTEILPEDGAAYNIYLKLKNAVMLKSFERNRITCEEFLLTFEETGEFTFSVSSNELENNNILEEIKDVIQEELDI